MDRRAFLRSVAVAGVVATLAHPLARVALAADLTNVKPLRMDDNVAPSITLSDAEWKKRLSTASYHVLREHGTEPAFTSPLNEEKRNGTFVCGGCGLTLFESGTKFDSGTGWPSFYAPVEGHVGTSTDYKLVVPRTEVHCARCGGHLGHVFDDGPAPTGKRYCMNGVALGFEAKV